MTEEDQKLVALAALHGARFCRFDRGDDPAMWGIENNHRVNKWTIGRAAEYYLWTNGMRSDDEHREYDNRTDVYDKAQEIDPEFLSSVLA